MLELIATHHVDDVAHWLSSPKRAEVFGSVASNISTFVDPRRPNHVGLRMDVADMAAFEAVTHSEAGVVAMADTLAVYAEGCPTCGRLRWTDATTRITRLAWLSS